MKRRQIREALGSEREALLSQLTEQMVSGTEGGRRSSMCRSCLQLTGLVYRSISVARSQECERLAVQSHNRSGSCQITGGGKRVAHAARYGNRVALPRWSRGVLLGCLLLVYLTRGSYHVWGGNR